VHYDVDALLEKVERLQVCVCACACVRARCIQICLSVSRARQWKERITSMELARSFGMNETLAEVIGKHRCT